MAYSGGIPFNVYDDSADSDFGEEELPSFHAPGDTTFSSDPESRRAYEDYSVQYDWDIMIPYYKRKLAILQDSKWFILYTAWNKTDNIYI